MVLTRKTTIRARREGKPAPTSPDKDSETTTSITNLESSDYSQVTINSSTVSPSSSLASLTDQQMPSVIDLRPSTSKGAVANDGELRLQDDMHSTAFRHEGLPVIIQEPLKDDEAKTSAVLPAESIPTAPTHALGTNIPPRNAAVTIKDLTQGKSESSVFCRICHEIGSTDIFISPCHCRGSLSLVHKHCLERWLAESNTSLCELCGYEYNTMRLPKHNICGSVFAWLFAPSHSRERKLLCWDLFSLSVLVPVTIMATSLGLKVLDTEMLPTMTGFVLAYTRFLQLVMMSLTVTLDAGVVTWMLIRTQYHFLHWYKWYQRNCKVILLGFPDSTQTAPAVEHISSSTVREMQF